MRHAVRALAIAVLLPLATPPDAGARVLLVGLDGASWSVIDPMLAEGRLPGLAALIERGATADLETVEPVISPAVWSSIATGRRPDVHGVTDFLKSARDVRVPTVFERAAASGRRVGVLDWLVAWPPQALPGGFVVPGWMRRDDATEPPGVLERVGPGYRYRLRGVEGRDRYVRNVETELRRKPRQWIALDLAFAPHVGAVTFYAIDAVSHRFWHDSFPEQFDEDAVPPAEPAHAHRVQQTVAGADRALAALAERLGPEDTLIVVSDHGFEAGDGLRRVWTGHSEAALARAGLVPGREAFTIEGQFGYFFLRVHPGPFAGREALLERLRAFYADAADAAGEALFTVEVFDRAERPPAARRPMGERLRQWVLGLLLEHWFEVRLDDAAHAFLLVRPNDQVLEAAWPDGPVRIAGEEVPLSDLLAADGFSGIHHPTAVFLAAGGPIRHVPERTTLSVLDVAPLLLWLAGVPVPDDLEGRVPTALLDPAALAAHPVERVPADTLERLPPPAPRTPPGGDARLIENLRSMGYLE